MVWESRYDDSNGVYYYFDPESNVSTWSRPMNYKPVATDFEELLDPSSGVAYYLDKCTGESTWERPACMGPAFAEQAAEETIPNKAGNAVKTASASSSSSKPMSLRDYMNEGRSKKAAAAAHQDVVVLAKGNPKPTWSLDSFAPSPTPQPTKTPIYKDPIKPSEFVDVSHTMCAVAGCTGPITTGGLCKLHYSIHLLDVSERRRASSGFEGRCAAPRCDGVMFKAGFCKAHYVEHQRNTVDHYQQGINAAIAYEEKIGDGPAVKYSKEKILLMKEARREEEVRRRDAEAKRVFEESQRERREAIERIKLRQTKGDLEMPGAAQEAPPPAPPSPPPPAAPEPPDATAELEARLRAASEERRHLLELVENANRSKESNEQLLMQKMVEMELELEGERRRKGELELREAEDEERSRREMEAFREEQRRQVEVLRRQLEDAERAKQDAESSASVNESELSVYQDRQREMEEKLREMERRLADEKRLKEQQEVERLRLESNVRAEREELGRRKLEEERLKSELMSLQGAQSQHVDDLRRQLADAERARSEVESSVIVNESEMTIYFEKQHELEQQLLVFKEKEEQENYNLKIAEALRKVEEEKNRRLKKEGEERRKQMELEMLREKNLGRKHAKGGSYDDTG
jgi:hypothetical protein